MHASASVVDVKTRVITVGNHQSGGMWCRVYCPLITKPCQGSDWLRSYCVKYIPKETCPLTGKYGKFKFVIFVIILATHKKM